MNLKSKLEQKFGGKKGFTLAELLIVVAVISILSALALIFIQPKQITFQEYDNGAEAIAVAAQNRLTQIRNSGEIDRLKEIGIPADEEAEKGATGGYRYLFNYDEYAADMEFIIPFGTIEYKLYNGYYAIGYQSETGTVGEVYYSTEKFGATTSACLLSYQTDKQKRMSENVGYYQGTVDESEIAFANLPTPQLTITNYEELVLSIELPHVKQLEDMGKKIGFVVSLFDKSGKAISEGLGIFDTAIYSTFNIGSPSAAAIAAGEDSAVIKPQEISSRRTYTMILDTVQSCLSTDMEKVLDSTGFAPPTGVFEDWAKKSGAYKDQYFRLGDNSIITVTVYCLEKDPKDDSPINPTFMPRSASITFNGWFNDCTEEIETNSDGEVKNIMATVDIACGRHLQNLEKLTELRSNLAKLLPAATPNGDGTYTYGNYSYGNADAYTEGSSNAGEAVGSSDIQEKYKYRSNVLTTIKIANQVNAIDFARDEWKDASGKQIPFTPINLPSEFTYYGNYLTINHLYVNAPFYAGLFGYANRQYLYDILLVNPSVTSQAPGHLAELYEIGVGALIGTSRYSHHINNCQAYMTKEGGVYDSENYRVQGECYVGGLIGFCEDEHIENCSASVYTGYRRGTATLSRYVGGLIGCITGDATAANSYAAGNLTGEYVGGLVGMVMEDSDPSGDDYKIYTCYTAGHIEYAEIQASGILGHVSELAGNAKSALNVYNNYCVVIYGEQDASGKYVWNSSAPIYGTFKGDGFEWLRTADTYIKAKLANHTYFGGAVFENNNKNYYIAQKGITYSNSPYFNSMYGTVQTLLNDIKTVTDKETLKSKVEAAEKKIFYFKKLQALEDLKACMDSLVEMVDEEAECNNFTLKLELDHTAVHDDKKDKKGTSLTVKQLVHAAYNGTYYDGIKDVTVKLTYDSSTNSEWNTSTTGIATYDFITLYEELKNTYEKLTDNDTSNDDAAEKNLLFLLGNSSAAPEVHTSKSGSTYYTYFYQKGLFYHFAVEETIYDAFDKAKDNYEDKGDKDGELLYRYLRGFCTDKIAELFCDLGISAKTREKMLLDAKKEQLSDSVQAAIDELGGYNAIIEKWNGTMASYKETAKNLVTAAVNAMKAVKTELDNKDSTTLGDKGKEAYEAMNELYVFFETHKDDKDVTELDGTTGDMRKFRTPIEDKHLGTAKKCAARANSGIESALEDLIIALGESDANVTALKSQLENDIKTYLGMLGDDWEAHDSGHRIKNSTDLRNVARGYLTGDTNKERDHSFGFMYDYGNNESGNPYYEKVPDSSYVDMDNGIYNNVFPYNESEFTKYYPFPFVYAREVENGGSRVLYVLFHYGDWLTEDLWVGSDINYHTDYPASTEYPGTESYDGGNIELAAVHVTNADGFSPDDEVIRSNDENIDVPYYFDGWYLDEDFTLPYQEHIDEVNQMIAQALQEGKNNEIDLYAKWVAKPSITFYAADLEGEYNSLFGNITVIIDTTIKLTVDGTQERTSEALDLNAEHTYNTITAWLKPGQDVSLYVKGHYDYRGNTDDGPVLEDRDNKKTYMLDYLTIQNLTELINPWFGTENYNKEAGTVNFSVPLTATFADKYELTISESSSGGSSSPEIGICLAEGTMIRMADGSVKAVEDLQVGDIVLSFDHVSGKYVPTPVWMTPHTDVSSTLYTVTALSFSDGTTLDIVGEHGLFDRTLNRYVFINEKNYGEFIGHEFSAISFTESGVTDRKVTLLSVSLVNKMTKIYSPITENNLNIVAEDLFTVTSMLGYGNAVMNLFEFSDDMAYDMAKLAGDISEYGVYSYEDFADLLPEDVFRKVPLNVMKVAVGKGLISFEEVRLIIQYIYQNGYLSIQGE